MCLDLGGITYGNFPRAASSDRAATPNIYCEVNSVEIGILNILERTLQDLGVLSRII